ncbi:DNA-processing protein DprA [Campylobacter sp. 19-13652]|uniref:DNA-processing protein DprA n=1 Tax=Campylobacter sp. 19-13652 TaxID=2840180 RepID=UPI001C78213C|nr:DNA-processing protein DprA [Campylobacter sp. 19-13652]BCX79507.1 DNA processing protein DprA [Campylobacter sp. 19-13652]
MKILTKDELPKSLNRLNTKVDPEVKSLYAIGETKLLELPKIAIVGSRKASVYTKELVSQLASTLASREICVVSGAALGVDIAAHTAALGHTIAVFGNGVDVIYPKSNSNTIKKILQTSLAISEYPSQTPPLAHHFLQRNRIVVALSQALVIAQADQQSGTMASANIAQRLGVPIYVLPQRLSESRGSNMLLEQGKASLLADFEAFSDKFASNKKALKAQLKDSNDEILRYCKDGAMLDDMLAKFGDIIYEYELDGKIEIKNLRVFAN